MGQLKNHLQHQLDTDPQFYVLYWQQLDQRYPEPYLGDDFPASHTAHHSHEGSTSEDNTAPF